MYFNYKISHNFGQGVSCHPQAAGVGSRPPHGTQKQMGGCLEVKFEFTP